MEFTLEEIKNIINEHKLIVDDEIYHAEYEKSRTLEEFCNILDSKKHLHQDYEKLAVVLLIDNLHSTLEPFEDSMETLVLHGVISKKFFEKIVALSEGSAFDSVIVLKRDYDFSYDALITLMRYLLKVKEKIIESPQYMYMRVALQIYDTLDEIKTCYWQLSTKQYTHASPYIYNSGTRRAQLFSCFLSHLKEDSIEGIYDTRKECAAISQSGGGIGLCLSTLRSKYSYIHSSQNMCKGIIPVLEGFEHDSKYIDQGGRRPGAICVYIEMSHPEIEEVLQCKMNQSFDSRIEKKIRELFLALWVPDLFMERVKQKQKWSCFDEKYQKELVNLYGEKYEKRYIELEDEEKFVRQLDAEELFNLILKSQIETGGPFICYKDTANTLSNQKNLGVIKSSNLCTEIFEVSSEKETAVCNLASINLSKCVINSVFDYNKLANLTRVVTRNLDRSIDRTYYCTNSAKISNEMARPIGIGVTGLQDVFMLLNVPFVSEESKEINKQIFETMYYAALSESCLLAKEKTAFFVKQILKIPWLHYVGKYFSGAYPGFFGSPLSQGQTHIDLFEKLTKKPVSTRYDWKSLKEEIMIYGVANSLCIALMPTVATSVIVGASESFEPITGNIITKKTLSGNFRIINKHLQKLLFERGEWNEQVVSNIIEHNGSVKKLECLTEYEKEVFKTVWEIDTIDLVNMCLDRAPFVDQSQSLSFFIENPGGEDFIKLGRLHFYTWENKLKTGMYYLRSLPVTQNSTFLQFKKKNKIIEEQSTSCFGCT